MDNNVMVVAGMHRSGTSLITHWLHACGLQVGDDLLEGGKGNIEGHFEDREFLKLHEHILGGQGADIDGLLLENEVSPSAGDRARMQALVKSKNATFTQWGWKEPRTCLFLDTYDELLPDAKYFVVQRDYKAVIGSLIQRDFSYQDERHLARGWLAGKIWTHFQRRKRFEKHCRRSAETYLRTWVMYNRMILATLERLPEQRYLVVSYATLKSRSEEVFTFLSSGWKFKLQYQSFSTIYKNSLISRSVSFLPFIQDQTLLAEANQLSEQFTWHLRRSGERLAALAAGRGGPTLAH